MNKLSKVIFIVAGLTFSTGVLAETSDGGPKVGDTAPAPVADSPPGTPNTYKEGEEHKGSSPYKEEDQMEQHNNLENSNDVQQGDVVQPLKEDHE